MVGKTIPEVKGISISEEGKPTGADLTASVTMSIGGYISAIEQAAANASHLGASKGDRLVLTTTTNAAKSTDATSDADGLAQAYATVGALTLSGDTITSMVIDAVQANVNFNAAGTITTDLSAAQPSKNELGADYGMGKVSSIGKEWTSKPPPSPPMLPARPWPRPLVSPSRRRAMRAMPIRRLRHHRRGRLPNPGGKGRGLRCVACSPCFCPSSCWPAAHPLPRRRRRVRSGMRPPFSPSLTP